MKILVTGVSGFIGAQLTKHLKSKGHVIYGISKNKIESKNMISLSLLDRSKLNLFFKRKKFDVVIHLAALLNNNDPVKMFQNNCEGTINLLECCRLNKTRKIVFASTHAVYGKTKYVPIDEDHPTTPMTNYAISKLIAENVCKMYFHSYGLNITILRITSVYGPGQPLQYLIPKMVTDCIKNKKMIIHKYLNGYQMMDLIHINDVCKAIELACKGDAKFGIYNIANGIPITVKDISEKLSKVMSIQNTCIKTIPKETNHFYYDTLNARNDLGFKAMMPLSEKTLSDIVSDIESLR